MTIIKKFESFMDDRERLREETRARGNSIISTFADEPGNDDFPEELEITADDTLAIGKEIADAFPIELIEDPVAMEMPININQEFPVDLIAEEPIDDFSSEEKINKEFPVDVTGFENY